MLSNEVEFKHLVDRYPRPVGDVVVMAAKIKTPTGKWYLVVFHEKATIEGWDALEIRRIDAEGELVEGDVGEVTSWIKDNHEDDMFASEMFGMLTGKFPYEIRETVKQEVVRHGAL